MDKLPKPLIALIDSIVEEYDHFTWNSVYLGDKMRVSLVWTRGEIARTNKGVKHKSTSNKVRDSKRLRIWKEKQEVENVIVHDSVENMENDISDVDIESEQSVDDFENDETISPMVASIQVNSLPVVTQAVRQSIDTGHKQCDKDNKETNIDTRTGLESESICSVNTQVIKNVNKNTDDTVMTIAPKEIITGKSPCRDCHYERIVISRTCEGDILLGKVKMREVLVTRNVSNRERLKHLDKQKDSDKSEYEKFISSVWRFPDVRKTDNEDFKDIVREIPNLDRYAEKFKLCPWCFEQ